MFKITISLFLMGLAFGWGPCLASCGPILIPYIAGNRKGILKSINTYILFSLARVSVYLALGVVVFFFGKFIIEAWMGSLSKYIYVALGAFLIIIGALTALSRDLSKNKLSRSCQFLHRNLLVHDKKSIVLMGFIIGALPCVPLLALFSYLGLVSKTWIEALIYSFSFGLGTAISPLLILSALAGIIQKFLEGQKPIYYKILSSICGLMMIFLGIQLIRQAYA